MTEQERIDQWNESMERLHNWEEEQRQMFLQLINGGEEED